LWLHSLKVAQLLRSAACLHTNQSRSYLNHLVCSKSQLLVTKQFRHFELHFINNLHRPMCPKTRLSDIDEMFRHVMNA